MAPRTGAERLLAPLAKAARAGIIPALAVAALLFASGCGGGGDPAARAGTSVAAEGGSNSGSAKEEYGSAPAAPRPSGEGSPSSPGSALNASSHPQAQKHPPITIPRGTPEHGPTAKQRAQATVADITLYSPDLPGSPTPTLSTAYTCEGKDSWPRLSWQGVPVGTKELVLLAMNSQPVEERLFFDWALARIDPSLSGLEAGKLPKGAVMGQNSSGNEGYSICPPPGSKETFIFILYAMPKPLAPKQGFDPLALREAALGISGNAGLMAVSYARG